MNRAIFILLASLLPLQSAYSAIELTDDLILSGFGSTSATRSDNDVPLFITRGIDAHTCYDCDTTFGIQLDYTANDQLDFSAQVVKRPQDHWSSPELEWAYGSWEQGDVTIHAGRQRLPLFLASEYYFVGHAYIWARPPQDVYESLLTFTYYEGFSLDWQYTLSDSQELTLTPFYGFGRSNEIDVGVYSINIDVDHTVGLAAELAGFNYRIYSAVMNTQYKISSPFKEESNLTIYTLGLDYHWDQWQILTELEADRMQTTWDATLAYHAGDFSPYVTYGESHQRRRSSTAIAGLRYFIAPKVSLNAEWQKVMMSEEAYKQGHEGYFQYPPIMQQEDKDASLLTFMINFIF